MNPVRGVPGTFKGTQNLSPEDAGQHHVYICEPTSTGKGLAQAPHCIGGWWAAHASSVNLVSLRLYVFMFITL